MYLAELFNLTILQSNQIMKKLIYLLALQVFGIHLFAQKSEVVEPPRIATFSTATEGSCTKFIANLPPLQQKAGAPTASWSSYWEFGDGGFSFENLPVHCYQKAGNYPAVLYATGRYDDGKPPKGVYQEAYADRGSNIVPIHNTVFDSTKLAIRMKSNRHPRANEQMVTIVSYRNLGNIRTDGRLFFFFNEKKFGNTTHFTFDSARTHYGEVIELLSDVQTIPKIYPAWDWANIGQYSGAGVSTIANTDAAPPAIILDNLLADARGRYKQEQSWKFQSLSAGEKRNMFLTLSGTPQMLQDTSAFIHVEAIFAPFDPAVPPERFEMEIEIVSAHDPNAIAVSDNKVNYRSLGKKKLDYKVRFQNDGEGPANTIKVEISIPKGLKTDKVLPLDWYPKCPICPEIPTSRSCLDTMFQDDLLTFTFKNIYLPGSSQKGVTDRDSTKGFIKYRIEPAKDMPKRNFTSRAAIFFDKEKPVYTNFSKTKFKTGLSPGLKIGYNAYPAPDSIKNGYPFIGVSFSPYKSWRWYPQIELLTGLKGRSSLGETTSTDTIGKYVPIGGVFTQEQDTFEVAKFTNMDTRGLISFEVPFLIRRNFSKFMGIGFGGSARVFLENGETITTVQRTEYIVALFNPPQPPKVKEFPPSTNTVPYKNRYFRYSAFVDLTFGSVRSGLNIGIRVGSLMGGKKQPIKPFAQVSVEMKL